MNEMFKLSDKNFKAVIIKMFQQAIINPFETNENLEHLSRELGNFRRELKV